MRTKSKGRRNSTNDHNAIDRCITLLLLFCEPIAFPSASASRLTAKNGSTTVSVSGATADAGNNTVAPTLGSSITSTKNDATGVIEDLAGNDLDSAAAPSNRLRISALAAAGAAG